MNKGLKIGVFILAFVIGFVPAFLYFTGFFDKEEDIPTNSTNNTVVVKETKVVYDLASPTLPLKNSKAFTYCDEMEAIIRDVNNNYSYTLSIGSNNELVIKNTMYVSEKIASSVKNVKNIIEDKDIIYVLTNDGNLYYLSYMIGKDIRMQSSLSFENLDSFKKIKSSTKFSYFVKLKNAKGENVSFVEGSDGKYYDLKLKDKSYVINKKYNSIDDVVKTKELDIYDYKYNFYIYDDGSIKYKDEEKEIGVLDEMGNPLYAYIMLPISENNIYVITLSNKMYSFGFNSIKDDKITARVISGIAASSIIYDENSKKEKITIKYSDGNEFEIHNVQDCESFRSF